MTYNKQVREKLTEWTNRLFKASYESLNGEWLIYWQKFHSVPIFVTLIQQALDKASLPESIKEEVGNLISSGRFYGFAFQNEEHRVAIQYKLLTEWMPNHYDELNNALIYLTQDAIIGIRYMNS